MSVASRRTRLSTSRSKHQQSIQISVSGHRHGCRWDRVSHAVWQQSQGASDERPYRFWLHQTYPHPGKQPQSTRQTQSFLHESNIYLFFQASGSCSNRFHAHSIEKAIESACTERLQTSSRNTTEWRWRPSRRARTGVEEGKTEGIAQVSYAYRTYATSNTG